MLAELQQRQQSGQLIQVGLIGAGAMGLGIAWQIGRTPGMELSFIADFKLSAAEKARDVYGKSVKLFDNADHALDDPKVACDVLVEATNCIGPAARYCLKAIKRKAHVVLMNAEVDLVLGHYLYHHACQNGVVLTSDAGDQHGVLKRMMNEIELWGFDIIQAGNMKGFLDRYATADAKREIAKKLNLSLVQCVAYTDGTKLNIEMALIANGSNLTPMTPGMQGPKADHVNQALELFDFDSYGGQGRVDYLLGAQPGGGVYVIGRCDDRMQQGYLNYYKVQSRFPYYLFYRPYHLCHLETTRAVAMAALWGKGLLAPTYGRLTDVYAHAKQSLTSGQEFHHGMGGDHTYGLVHTCANADRQDLLPIGVLESESSGQNARLKRVVAKDEAICWPDVDLPETELLHLYRAQQELLASTKKPELTV